MYLNRGGTGQDSVSVHYTSPKEDKSMDIILELAIKFGGDITDVGLDSRYNKRVHLEFPNNNLTTKFIEEARKQLGSSGV